MLDTIEIFNKSKVIENFKTAFKNKENLKTGIEYERLPISVMNYKSAPYNGENGICNLLRKFAITYNWEYITDDYNIIGIKNGEDTITLEPGSQLELSLSPEKNIADLKNKINDINKKMLPILKKYKINLLEYGVSPVSTYRFIDLIPKSRYSLMANYLWGILSDVMMRETAGIQACFDYVSEENAIESFKIANILSPFVTAMCANSPIRGGVDTGYKTFRALAWLNTDNERCRFMSRKLFNNKDYSFNDYIEEVLDIPMIYIVRNGKNISVDGKITFKQFMQNGYEGYNATLEDFKLHENLYFPDVRLRNFIEIRNQDCSGQNMQYAILALYKSLLYDKTAKEDIKKLLSKFTYKDIQEFRYSVPRMALSAKIGKYYALDIAKEIVKIAKISLKSSDEEKYLAPLVEISSTGQTFADIIIKNWYGSWNKDISKMIKYITKS